MDNVENKKVFCGLLRGTGRRGMERVLTELEAIGFFQSPASCKVHLTIEGGLLQHALNVYNVARMMAEGMRGLRPDIKIDDNSLVIASLLHDVCKCGHYNVEKEGHNTYNYENFPAGHGEKSVFMLLRWGLEMTDDEILAIRWHMGAFSLPFQREDDVDTYTMATKNSPLVNIIHAADTLAARCLE